MNKQGNIQEVTVYIDGIYEYSYTKNSGSIDSNRNYNTLHITDGTTRVGTQRTGNDADDSTPAQKYFVEDHLGNCSVTVKTNGGRINMEEYYPFGQTSFGSFAKKRYRYNGKEKDEYTGLYEYGQRYHAPWLCRFVSVDPIAEDFPHLSFYNYASNRPVTSIDAEGLQTPDEPKNDQAATGNAPSAPSNDGLLKVEVHKVKEGDTISGLSQQYGVSEDQIRRANPQTQERGQSDQINIGENIIVPTDVLPDNDSFADFNSRDAEGINRIEEKTKVRDHEKDLNSGDSKNEINSRFTNFTFKPEITAKFEFGVGVKMNIPAKTLGFSADYASLNFVGFQSNDFYFAGENISEGSDIREINEEYGLSYAGFGRLTQNVYENSRSGRLKESSTSIVIGGVFQEKVITRPLDSLIITQSSINLGVNFGAILMPELGINLIFHSDTIRYTP